MSSLLGRSARAMGPLLLVFAFTRDLAAQTFGVAVTPQGSTIANKTAFTTGLTYAFRVTNEGTQQDTYTLNCVGNINITCTNWPASVTLAGDTFQDVTVTFSTASQGTGQLYLSANSANASDTGWVYVPVVPGAGQPRVSFLPYLEAKQDYGRCAASCFAATYAQSTVPYFSLDAPRNLTLVYHGDRVAPKPFVLVDVAPDSAYGSWPTEYQLQVKVNAALVTFLNGEQTLRFSNPANVTYRIGGQFTPPADTNGTVRTMEILVTAKYTGGAQFTNRMITRYLHLDEASGKIARGWTLAGIQRAFITNGTGILVTEGDGSATYFTFNPGILKYEAPTGDFSRLDSVGTTWVRSYPDSTKATFNSTGLMVKLADRWAVRDTVVYDASKRVTQVKDHLNNVITLAYDANGLDNITDPFSRVTQVTVDASKRLTAIQDPDGFSTTFGYDASLRLQTITDRRGKATTLAYLLKNGIATNKLSTVTAPSIPIYPSGSASPVTTFAPWQVVGVPYVATAVTAFTPPKTDTVYARITEPQGASYVTKFTVNRWGSPAVATNALGEVTTVTYTAAGQPSTNLRPGFGTTKDTMAYNGSGLLTWGRPAGDSATTIVYGGWAQPTSVTTPGRPTVTNSLGANGRVNSVTWGGVTRESYTYDSYGRLTKVTDALGTAVRRLGYPISGSHRNLTHDTLPGPRITIYTYDTYGRPITATPPDGVQQVTHYNSMNWVDSVRVLTSPVTRTKFQYTRLGQDTIVTDPKNQVHRYVHNDLGWLTEQRDPLNVAETFQYNVGGEVKRWTNRRGQTIDFSYDVLHRLTSRAGSSTATWTYTANSLVVSAAVTGVATVTTYPSMLGPPDSVKTVLNGFTYWQRLRYTSAGLDSVFFTGSQDVTHFKGRRYLYDANSAALTTIRLGGSGTGLGTDANLNLTSASFPGGASRTLTQGSLQEPTKEVTEAANNTLLERWLGFNVLGQIDRHLRHTAKIGRWFYYDSLGQLRKGSTRNRIPDAIPGGCPSFDYGMSNGGGTNCTPGADYNTIDSLVFTYDSVGNRTDLGGAYTTGNRITAFNSCTYTTDAEGNVTGRSGGSCPTPATFFWTKEGQLDSLHTGTTGIRFLYDAEGRLTIKRMNGVVQAYFLWDGTNLLAQLNSTASAVVTEYSYYGVDAPHAVIKQPAGTRFYARVDGLGNVIALTNESSVIRRSYSYDDWGKDTGGTDTEGFSGTDRARWKGALWIGPEVELYYMRSRWYEPHTGRFLSEDPLGIAGGINPLVFAANDPANGFDPSGYQQNLEDVISTGQRSGGPGIPEWLIGLWYRNMTQQWSSNRGDLVRPQHGKLGRSGPFPVVSAGDSPVRPPETAQAESCRLALAQGLAAAGMDLISIGLLLTPGGILARAGFHAVLGLGARSGAAAMGGWAARGFARHGLTGLPLGEVAHVWRGAGQQASVVAGSLRRIGTVLGGQAGANIAAFGPPTGLKGLVPVIGHLDIYRAAARCL